ncbi:MAG: hypothetical protein JWM35_2651 [Verrucomicrobia bacterium]|nr:hypothetical protein [Verrucomicrobiota bacterium]
MGRETHATVKLTELPRTGSFSFLLMAGTPHPAKFIAMTALVTLSANAEAPVSDTSIPEKRARIVSSHIAAAISDGLPKYSPVQADAKTSPAVPADEARNTIIHLPTYIVREKRPPSPEDLLTAKGWENDAAERYLGPKDGLDRSLNAVTLTDLWRKIPILGKIPFVPFGSMSNGERAQFLNERIESKRRWTELLDFGQPEPATKKPKKNP